MNYALLALGLCGLISCSKKEEPIPSYADFTLVSGSFTIYRPGASATVLSELQLRREEGKPGYTDIYHFKGGYSPQETLELQFIVDKNRTGNGPWKSPLLTIIFFSRTTGNITLAVTGDGTLSVAGKTVTADFQEFYNGGVAGTLK